VSKRDESIIGWTLAVVGAWIVLRSSQDAEATALRGAIDALGPTLPNAVVPVVRTGSIPRDQFDREHFNALLVALGAHNAPLAVRRKLARAMLAHMVTETGRTAEYNFNVANSHPNANWRGSVFVLPRTTIRERAYPSLQAGVDDYAHSITGATYGALVGELGVGLIDEMQWYRETREAGWSESAPTLVQIAEFQSILSRLRAVFPD